LCCIHHEPPHLYCAAFITSRRICFLSQQIEKRKATNKRKQDARFAKKKAAKKETQAVELPALKKRKATPAQPSSNVTMPSSEKLEQKTKKAAAVRPKSTKKSNKGKAAKAK
jgi:cell division septation protein DedD